MSNLTHLQGRSTKVKYMSRILEKNHVGSETGSGSETRTSWKVVTGFTTLVNCVPGYLHPGDRRSEPGRRVGHLPVHPPPRHGLQHRPLTHTALTSGTTLRNYPAKCNSSVFAAWRLMKSLPSRSLFFLCNSKNSSILFRVQSSATWYQQPVLRIRDVYPGFKFFHPGSKFFPTRIPGPHQRI